MRTIDKVYNAARLIDNTPCVFYGSIAATRGWWFKHLPTDSYSDTYYMGKNWRQAVASFEREVKERRFSFLSWKVQNDQG